MMGGLGGLLAARPALPRPGPRAIRAHQEYRPNVLVTAARHRLAAMPGCNFNSSQHVEPSNPRLNTQDSDALTLTKDVWQQQGLWVIVELSDAACEIKLIKTVTFESKATER